MSKTVKTIAERVAHADERGSYWLSLANEAAEQGKHEKAERLYDKGQYWLDLSNKLRGCGE
jgi:hypothetical protein